MWLIAVKLIGDILIKVGLHKKAQSDASKVDALEKALEGVESSLVVERAIRDKQSLVDSDVGKGDGLSFDKFNEGE